MDIDIMDRYVPKIGDIFYYSVWWLSSVKTGYRLLFRLNFSYQLVFYKALGLMYLKKIYKVELNEDLEFQSLIYNGLYGVYGLIVLLGKLKLVRLDRKFLRMKEDRRPLILDWLKNRLKLILSRTFLLLIVRIQLFGKYFLFNKIDLQLNRLLTDLAKKMG